MIKAEDNIALKSTKGINDTANDALAKANASVTSDTLHYLATSAGSGVTKDTSGWTTTVQKMTATNKYLWTYHTYTKANGTTVDTNPVITGTYGKDGTNGVSVTKVEPEYYMSTSATSATGGSWSATMTYVSGRYIWTREKVTYSSGNPTYSTAIYNSALTTAWINASNAHQIASNTNQYFWHTSTGSDTGAHITEKTQEAFLADPANGGGNLLARSNGIAVRDGLEELSRFESAGVQIGAGNLPHSVFTANALEFFKNASDKVAQFGTNIIRIGMDSVSTTIKFCKDLIQFKTETYVSPTPNPQYGSNGIRSVLGVDLKDSTEYDGVALDTTAKFRKKYERLNSGGQIIDASTYSGMRASAGTFNASTQMLSEYEETNEATSEHEKKTLSVFNSTSQSDNMILLRAYMEHTNANNETVAGNANIQISAQGSVQNYISALTMSADSIWFTPQREFVSTMALQVVSDRNLKEHVSYLGKDAIDFVRELKPVCYIKDGGNHVGFYAQDVEAIDKWDCMTSESDGIKTLGYTELIAPLVAYCQHLEDRIRKLEEK